MFGWCLIITLAKCGQIFKILYQLIRTKILYVNTTTISTAPAIYCYTTLWMMTECSYKSIGERILKTGPHLPKLLSNTMGVYFILRHSVYVDNGSKGLWHLNKLSLRTAQWLLAGRHHELKNLTHFSHKNYEIFWKGENSILSSGAIVCFGLLFETYPSEVAVCRLPVMKRW